MAEGILKRLCGDYFEVHSAGTDPDTVNPYAVEVMANKDIDISRSRSKSLKEFEGVEFDYVVTVCEEGVFCPFFIGGKTYIHKSFPDPSKVGGDESRRIKLFTQIRDEIEVWIKEFLVNQDWIKIIK